MTLSPNEKALELYNKMYLSIATKTKEGGIREKLQSLWVPERAKACAHIAVDEILAANKEVMKLVDGFYMKEYRMHIEYWKSVKQAIDNLK